MAGGLPILPSRRACVLHFAIEIDGVEIAQFSEVSGLTSELDVIELKENTADGKLVIHKAPGAIKPPTLTSSAPRTPPRRSGTGTRRCIQGKVGGARKNGSVVLKSYDGTEVARYNFNDAWVSKIERRHAQGGRQRGPHGGGLDRQRGDRAGRDA